MFINWLINNFIKKLIFFSIFIILIYYVVIVLIEKEWVYSIVRDKIVWKLMVLF